VSVSNGIVSNKLDVCLFIYTQKGRQTGTKMMVTFHADC